MNATTYNIQRFSLHDGAGIRTVIFLKGCPLRCAWCSNPESQKFKPEIMYNKRICLRCGSCVAACKENVLELSDDGVSIARERCTGCGSCSEACPANAMRTVGTPFDLDEIIAQSVKDMPYYIHSDGGVTLSGGEPLAQGEAAFYILRKLKEKGVHTVVETCGYVDSEVLLQVIPYVNLFIFDYKLHDREKHKEYTGVDNELILNNLRLLKEHDGQILLRLPLIPGINMDEAHYMGVCELINELHIHSVEVIPFHQYGKGKYGELQREYHCDLFSPSSEEEVQRAQDFITKMTSANVTR